jgi:hypothetical protein
MAIIEIHAYGLAELTKLVVKSVKHDHPFWRTDSAANTECIKRLREVTGLSRGQARNLVDVAFSNDPVWDAARKICRE